MAACPTVHGQRQMESRERTYGQSFVAVLALMVACGGEAVFVLSQTPTDLRVLVRIYGLKHP